MFKKSIRLQTFGLTCIQVVIISDFILNNNIMKHQECKSYHIQICISTENQNTVELLTNQEQMAVEAKEENLQQDRGILKNTLQYTNTEISDR